MENPSQKHNDTTTRRKETATKRLQELFCLGTQAAQSREISDVGQV